jgi:hypothetical protein
LALAKYGSTKKEEQCVVPVLMDRQTPSRAGKLFVPQNLFLSLSLSLHLQTKRRNVLSACSRAERRRRKRWKKMECWELEFGIIQSDFYWKEARVVKTPNVLFLLPLPQMEFSLFFSQASGDRKRSAEKGVRFPLPPMAAATAAAAAAATESNSISRWMMFTFRIIPPVPKGGRRPKSEEQEFGTFCHLSLVCSKWRNFDGREEEKERERERERKREEEKEREREREKERERRREREREREIRRERERKREKERERERERERRFCCRFFSLSPLSRGSFDDVACGRE